MALTSVEGRDILQLPDYRDSLPTDQRRVFDRIFELRKVSVPLVYPSEEAKLALAGKFKVDPVLISQREVLRVTNQVWGEETTFNPLRANRPLQLGSSKKSLESISQLESDNPQGDNCDFCTYPDKTPGDPFGDVKGEFCISRANVAGYDGLHALILDPRVHNPRDLTADVISDMIHTARPWFLKANEYARQQGISDADYPFMMMNIYPRAGASVFHPHMQALLAIGEPYMKVRNIRNRMGDYQWLNKGRSYLTDLSECLEPLGLVEHVDRATVVFNPVPIKESEVLVVSDDLEGLPNGSLSKAVARVIDWWRSIGVTSFNMAIYMPKLGEGLLSGDWYQFRPFARLVNRGPEGNNVADVAGMELYGSSVVATDPFILADGFSKYLGQTRQSLTGVNFFH